jgi:hypothetical protein
MKSSGSEAVCYAASVEHGMAGPRLADGGYDLQILKVPVRISNTQSQSAGKGWSSGLVVGRRTNYSPYKNKLVTKCHNVSQSRCKLVPWLNY